MSSIASVVGEPTSAKGGLILFLGLLGALIWWRWEMRRHPDLPCRECGGTGRSRSELRAEATGDCSVCKGKGGRGGRRMW